MYVLDDGSLWSFGYNHAGQLGTGNTETTVKPHQVLESGVSLITLNHSHGLILKTDGSLWGLGANFYGQLGTGTTVCPHREWEPRHEQ
jgi:alpha-tubulin suppressor-like RCC1 family protein